MADATYCPTCEHRWAYHRSSFALGDTGRAVPCSAIINSQRKCACVSEPPALTTGQKVRSSIPDALVMSLGLAFFVVLPLYFMLRSG